MFADTDAIRALGSAASTQAADLADIAVALSSLPVAAAEPSLGPIGARFLAALTEAAADGSRAVTRLSEQLYTSKTTAYAIASAYDTADGVAGTRIAGG
jgi:hypothetical protein